MDPGTTVQPGADIIRRLEIHGHKAFGPTVAGHGKGMCKQVSHAQSTQAIVDLSSAHLALWRRTVGASPVSKTNGRSGFRSESTVGSWMVAVCSFYEWADAHALLATAVHAATIFAAQRSGATFTISHTADLADQFAAV
jgi:hypothetical protein